MTFAFDPIAACGFKRVGFETRIPQLVTRYTLNSRGHWSKGYRENKRAKSATALALSQHEKPTLPVTVTMTRCAPRRIDDDNNVASFKGVRDSIAKWLGVNDNDPRVTWVCEQAKATKKAQGTVIRVESVGDAIAAAKGREKQ